MGFFGFLKKQPLPPPQKPQERAPATFSPMEQTSSSDIPPPPQPDFFDSLPAELVHNEVHRELDLEPTPTMSAEPRHMEPPLTIAISTTVTSQPEHDAPLPELPPAKEAQEPQRTPAPEKAMTKETKPLDIPDFSEEEMAAAERLKKAHKQHEKVLPPLSDVRELLPPAFPDELYVPASQYEHAFKLVASFKASTRKGDAALGKLTASLTQHKQSFAGFAETINSIQQDLIQMDNIMIGQR